MGCIERKGYDVVVSKVGAKSLATCRVCGSAMDVQRDVVGPTGFASAMGKISTLHDRWTCTHSGAERHYQALRILLVNADEPSPTVAARRQNDLEVLIRRCGTGHSKV